jgi:hypothetical protein
MMSMRSGFVTGCESWFLREAKILERRLRDLFEDLEHLFDPCPSPPRPVVPARIPTAVNLQRNPVTMAFELVDSGTATISTSTPILDAAGQPILNADGTPATTAQLGIAVAWSSTNPSVVVDSSSGAITPGQPLNLNSPATITGAATLPSGVSVSVQSQDVVVIVGDPATIPTVIA